MFALSRFAEKALASPYLDGTLECRSGPLLGSPNKMKFMVFCANTQRGTTMSHADGTLRLTWENSQRLIRAVDETGIEAIVPLAKWKDLAFLGPDNARVFETFTWAAAAAAITRNVQILTTLHMPLYHPVMAAKMLATLDHVSNGRAGLNVVAGWNTQDFAMFGHRQREHDDRYAAGAEWMDFLCRMFEATDPFDFAGEYYQGQAVVSEPKPLQRPRPAIMSAGFSPSGRAFAQKYADLNFVALQDVTQAEEAAISSKKAAWDNHRRDILVCCGGWIVCRDTEKEARAYADYVIKEKGDRVTGEAGVAELIPNSHSIRGLARDGLVERYMAGFFGLPLVGTPEQIVEKIGDISKAGIDGMAISWVDYEEGVARYRDELLPRLIQAGLRVR